MKLIVERTLTEFQFWSGARHNALLLTSEELDELEQILDETGTIFGEPYTETQINDLFWFSFDEVCNMLGYKYDFENDKVIRPKND